EQGEQTGVFRQTVLVCGGCDARNLVAGNLDILHPEQSRFSLIGRPRAAVEGTETFHLIVVPRVFVARQRRWTLRPELRTALQGKRRDVAPRDEQRSGVGLINAWAGSQSVWERDGGAVRTAQRENHGANGFANRNAFRLGSAIGDGCQRQRVGRIEISLAARIQVEQHRMRRRSGGGLRRGGRIGQSAYSIGSE